MTPEGKIKAKLKRELDKLGDDVYQFRPVQNGMGSPGLDVFLSVRGVFIAIETKKPGGKPTARQLATMATIEKSGGAVYVVSNDEEMHVALQFMVDIINAARDIELLLRESTNQQVH